MKHWKPSDIPACSAGSWAARSQTRRSVRVVLTGERRKHCSEDVGLYFNRVIVTGFTIRLRLSCQRYVTLEHKTSVKLRGCICSNSQQYIVWLKIIHFYFMPKIIRILRSCTMKIFSTFRTINLIIDFDLSNLKIWFSLYWDFFFCTLRFQIFKYCPSHTSMEILFIQLSDDAYISIYQNLNLWLVLCSGFAMTSRSYSNVQALLHWPPAIVTQIGSCSKTQI